MPVSNKYRLVLEFVFDMLNFLFIINLPDPVHISDMSVASIYGLAMDTFCEYIRYPAICSLVK